MSSNKSQPITMVERYNTLISLQQMNIWIEALEGIYRRTHDEGAYQLLSDMKAAKANDTKEFWEMEEIFRKEELEEFHKNPGAYPHSVITWMLYYRDRENA